MTAVEWLISQLNTWQSITDEDTNQTLDTVRKLVEQAKKQEKQDIITAYAFGHNDGCRYMNNDKQEFEHGEQYYKETFVNNK
jgi:hypothetical protein